MNKPQFCPNKNCKKHPKGVNHGNWYQPWGNYPTKTFKKVTRYRCRECGKTFSTQSFSIDYYAKKIVDYQSILNDIATSSGIRDTARRLNVSTSTVQNRMARLARQAIYVNETLCREYVPAEDLCADGFESFNVSQYYPNNTHVLLGSESQFICGIDSVTIRRKGRMTEAQRERREALEKICKAPAGGIKKSFKAISLRAMEIGASSGKEVITLNTDEHKSYPQGLKEARRLWEKKKKDTPVTIEHVRVSSRKPRTRSNIIYASNYIDREFRKDLAPHVRESVQFSRNYNDDMFRMTAYVFRHNFIKVYRIKNERKDKRTHAEAAGISLERIEEELENIYTERRFLSHLEDNLKGSLSFDYMRRLWLRELDTPLKKTADYCPRYCSD